MQLQIVLKFLNNLSERFLQMFYEADLAMLVYPGYLWFGYISKWLLVYSLIPSQGCVLIYGTERLGQVATLFCQQLKRRGLWASAEGLNVKKQALPPSHQYENHPLGLEMSRRKWWGKMKKASIVKKNKTCFFAPCQGFLCVNYYLDVGH